PRVVRRLRNASGGGGRGARGSRREPGFAGGGHHDPGRGRIVRASSLRRPMMSKEMRERRGAASRVIPVAVGVAALIAALVIVSFRSNDPPAAGRLIKVSAVDFRYHGFPKVIHPGLFQVAFTNQ